MLAFLLLAVASARCALPQLCPTDREILDALRQADTDFVFAETARAEKANPNELVFIRMEGIQGISGVVCGERISQDEAIVNCKFTVRHPASESYEVASLKKTGDGWAIKDALIVNRKRSDR